MTYEMQQLVLNIEGLEVLGQYDKRQTSILTLMTIASSMDYETGFRTVPANTKKPDWAGDVVAYIELPTGEISYFLQKSEKEYTGYSREVKLERIRDFVELNMAVENFPEDFVVNLEEEDGGIFH